MTPLNGTAVSPGAADSSAGADASRDELVLVLAPTGRDVQLTCALLSERGGVTCTPCSNVIELCTQVRRGAGCAVIAEEALDVAGANKLMDTLSAQLPWSDLPVLVLTNSHDIVPGDALAALRQRGNVTVLDRPVRIVTLLTAVQSALRARRRQYEVRDLLAETREAIRHRDQFLAMLGHELRNPLGAINNALSVIDAASPAQAPIESEHREIIRRQAEHLARLVDDLLDVSRITSGKITLQKRPTDLCELVRRAVKSVDGPARAQRHELVLDTACPPTFVHGDSVRIEQIVNNLLTNAIKYTPPGGRIEIHVDADKANAVLCVRDNGIGITPELLPRVFDLFTQAERALDRSQGGLGIGLTLVRALVEMHEGTVTVQSAGAGTGCRFIITLPRIPAPREAEKPAAPAPASETVREDEGRRVLIVEDQPDARRAFARLLQLWGHRVEAAEDGLAGLERAGTFHPDIAFIDVGLPGLDGYELARRIRHQENGRAIRLVALTGYGQPEDRERAFEAGFDLHLVKPVDQEQLKRALSERADMMIGNDAAVGQP